MGKSIINGPFPNFPIGVPLRLHALLLRFCSVVLALRQRPTISHDLGPTRRRRHGVIRDRRVLGVEPVEQTGHRGAPAAMSQRPQGEKFY